MGSARITNEEEETPRSTTERERPVDDKFASDGFVCLKQTIPRHHLKEWQQFSNDYFIRCFENLHQNGHSKFPTHVTEMETDDNNNNGNHHKSYAMGLGIKHGFREIVMRSPGRYELSLLHCLTECPPIDLIKESLFPLIPNLLGSSQWDEVALCHLSLVVSTPGSPEQSWHADGGHVSCERHLPCHVVNVFIPLQDVTRELGPTEFRPKSHVYTRNLAPMMLAARARKQLLPPVAPTLRLGDVLLFDYRVLHRGTANRSTKSNRTFLVLTFAKTWYKDICNFPARSMFVEASHSSTP